MKILGIVAGRHRQNSEFWITAALKGAEEAGAEVELVNLRDLDIKPCTGCCVCHTNRFNTGYGTCVHKDDMAWLDEQILECDGMIVCAPCFENSPPSEIKLFCDRLGPSHDIVMVKDAHEKLLAQGKEGLDTRWFKRRPVAFISHGGSEWTTFGVPILSVIAVPLGLTIVDLLTHSFTGASALDDAKIERTKELGRHVVANCGRSDEDMEYMGDFGHCPMCHNNIMILGQNANEVTCPVCGMEGSISVADGKIKVHFDPSEFKKSHVTDSGKYLHMLDMYGKGKEQMVYSHVHADELKERVKNGTGIYKCCKPEKK